MASSGPFKPLVAVVDFHHARGPEVESWFGAEEGQDPAIENDWSVLPFLALPDGSHASDEAFSYFTLCHTSLSTSLFGISCTRHIASSSLLNRHPDVTRTSVQKAVVAIVQSPGVFVRVRESLSAITKAWFAQRNFEDTAIIQAFQESLIVACSNPEDERDQYFGMSLREVIHDWKHQMLVLFKACLLQRKMLFYGTNCEKLCLLQFALISLVPGLIRNLRDCAAPRLNTYERDLVMPTSLKTSERASLLAYMGLPLQLFGEGSLFGPYTPLQQLDVLEDASTKSYIAGTTNSLVLQNKDRYCEILVNVDDYTINIFSPAWKSASSLSASDRRWIDFLTQNITDTWDPDNPTLPSTHGYAGSEDFIRLQFEEYILAILASVKYRKHVEKHGGDPKALISETIGDPAADFGNTWVDAWTKTDNFRIFTKSTDSHLFDIIEPKHPCAGGLTVEDVQRRLVQQINELHLDERLTTGRETLNKHLVTGQERVSATVNKVWADIEVLREAQRKKAEARRAAASSSTDDATSTSSRASRPATKAPDLSQAQANLQAASVQAQASVQAGAAKASAYLSSWGNWAAEKRKERWPSRSANSQPPLSPIDEAKSGPSREEIFNAPEPASPDAKVQGKA